MADMKNHSKKLTEEEIDEIVIREADDLSKWEEPIQVKAPQATSIRLSPQTIQKAKLLASIHKAQYQAWLEQIVEERIHLEEELLDSIKSNLKESNSNNR